MTAVTAPGRFAGRTIVVTGAGSGIGHATALRIIAEGGHVVAADIDALRLQELVEHAGKDCVTAVPGDITDASVIEQIIGDAPRTIDGLANVAGIMDGFLPPAELDDDTWQRVLNVNLTATMRLTRAVLPAMIEAGAGAIVNVASEAALRPSAAGAAYAASKHAVVGYTKSVAFFHGPQGVRANVVAPGPTVTNIEGAMRSLHARQRSGPVMQATMPVPAAADQVAAAIVWLLSDDASNINGVLLPSDGGWSVA